MKQTTSQMGGPAADLLRKPPWNSGMGFLAGVEGYAAGLHARTDWRQVRERLADVSAEQPDRHLDSDSGEAAIKADQQQIDSILARRWAQTNLDAAMNWYVQELDWNRETESEVDRTVSVLRSVPRAESYRVANWMGARRSTNDWNDQVVVTYLAGQSYLGPDTITEELAALPESVDARAAIISAYATPRVDKEQFLLNHPPEALRRLIEAADLPEEVRLRWTSTVALATWEEP